MRKKCIFALLFSIILLCVVIGSTVSSCLQVNDNTLDLNLDLFIRIVQLTDLHNAEFGKDNSDLINKIKEQNPDLIFMTGDMLNDDDENTDTVCSLIENLSMVAPIYYSFGNHEAHWNENFSSDISTRLKDAGAIVLECEYVDVRTNGNDIRIGGYYGYYGAYHMVTKDADEIKKAENFAEDFENTNRLKLLLCHIPTSWLDWEYYNKYDVDVVFSGHYHGGQARLPFVGGIYAPYVGWFPKYTQGMFQGEKATVFLSSGLGSDSWFPRFCNPPEITVVDIK